MVVRPFGPLAVAPAVSKNGSQQCALFPPPSFAPGKGVNFPVFLRRIFG
jgi:hypothetical protein